MGLVAGAAIQATDCTPTVVAQGSSTAKLGDPVAFSLRTLDGEQVSSRQLRDRVSVIVFLTTFDPASQIQAKLVGELLAEHVPRINALGVILEGPQSRPLAEVYRDSLELPYPLAMADATTLGGGGALGGIRRVPTIVLLGRRGEILRQEAGLVPRERLRQLVRAATGPAP